jgi:O-antigen/teichoic acid export membrane protein
LLSLLLLLALGAAHVVWQLPEDACFLLLPLSAVLAAAYSCGQQWSARASNYRPFARSQVTTAIVNVGTGASLGLLAGDLFGSLVIGFVAGLAAGTFHLVVALLALRRSAAHPLLPPNLADVVAAAREYRRFPFFVLPSTLIATLGTSAQPFLLQAMFSLREVGLFAVASRFLLVPASLVGGAVSEAFRAEFVARMQGQRTLTDFFAQTLRRLVLFALPVFALFFVAAPDAFAIAFGESYRASGVYARFLCLGVLAQFVAQPFQYVFVATGHVRLGLVVQTIAAALPLLGLVAGGHLGGIGHALMLSSTLSFATAALLIASARHCCRASDRASFGEPVHA